MRLIDPIRLKQSLAVSAILEDKKTIEQIIDEQPTIEERKTGRWIGKYPVTSACSECNYLIHDSKVKVFAYCPNCGAKMEG